MDNDNPYGSAAAEHERLRLRRIQLATAPAAYAGADVLAAIDARIAELQGGADLAPIAPGLVAIGMDLGFS